VVDVINDTTQRLEATVTRLPSHCGAGHSRRYPYRLRLLVGQLCLTARVVITVPALISTPVSTTNTTIRTPHGPNWAILSVVVRLGLRAFR
jgi:hypothetical protein